MLIHVVSRPLSDLSHIPRSGVRTLAHMIRQAGGEVIEDIGLTGDFAAAVSTCAEQLRRQWAEKTPELVHTVGLVATMAAVHARPAHLPIVSTFDESPAPSELEKRLAREINAVVPLSGTEQDTWRRLGARTMTAGALALTSPVDEPQPCGGTDVICLCRGPWLDTVVESMPFWGSARLVLASRIDEQRLVQLQRKAQALGVADRLVYRPGLRGDARAQMWHEAGLLLAGPEGARHGGHVLEAAGHAIGSVAVSEQAHLDHVIPGSTGVLIPVDADARELGRTVSGLIADPLRRKGMGSSAWVRVRAMHDQPAMGQRLLNIYSEFVPDEVAVEPVKTPPRLTESSSELALQYLPLARQLAQRYAGRGQRLDDLVQVASLGLVRAASRFNPDLGNEFHSFAVPTILGELRRHFRDHAWAARVPRSLQEMTLKVQKTADELNVARGQEATPADVAEELGVVEEEVLQAMQARGEAMSTKSLDHPMGEDGNEAFGDLVGDTDSDLEYVELREAVREGLMKLPEREREILLMRFYGEHTQSEIAERLGLSQVHVSRLITRTLAALRDHVMYDVPLPKAWETDADEPESPQPAARRKAA
jgi:RNA polymerase sigma-B factor